MEFVDMTNQDGQTTCPDCAGSGKQYIKGNMDKDWREIECLHCHGIGTVPSEPIEQPISSSHENGTDSLEQEISLHDEIVRLRKERGAHLMDENEYTDAIMALIRRREIALLERTKREYAKFSWGHYDVFAVIDTELERFKKGEGDE